MLKKLVYVSLFVTDQDKALDFYTNVLGLEKRYDVPQPDGLRFLTVAVPGQDVELVLWPGTPGRAKPAQGVTPGAYTIETADCKTQFETLRSRGVKFEPAEVLERPWGFVAILRDPDGNLVQLRQGRPIAS
jgi:catechol 2,3-dioxygenase-like lactoylglutathione lyase family enzyme